MRKCELQARKIKIHHQTFLKLKRLKKLAEQDGAYRVSKRIHAVLLNSDGKTSGEIANIMQSPRSKISEWLRNYDDYGYEGLLEGHRSGRPKELNDFQRCQLEDIIESGPVAYGFLSGVWTAVMIKKVIEEEFSIQYHPGHVRKILHAMDFSVQRPKRQLAKADPKKQNKWNRYTYPSIKKKRMNVMGG
jgi:transposase